MRFLDDHFREEFMNFASLVTRTQLVLGIAVMGSSLALAAACSSTTSNGTGDGGTGTSGGTSGATSGGTSGATSGGTSGATSGGTSGGGVVGAGKCGSSGSSTSTCTKAETDTYNSCLTGMCDSQYQAALGSGYKTGSYGGACGTYITCTQACACNDTACYMKCGQPDSACTMALTSASSCAMTKCPPPACLTAGKDAGTSGTSGSSGGTMHTCAELMACCAKIADASTKSACDQTYTAVMSMESSCNAVYPSYAASCP
jgi:hypothetical protein